ncbi:AMP-binding protein [Mycolicibacterium gadium]|uniref:AMP-binding protein n=1 Tax=Mycolicibacterium gadium TaxID=1794 RepID=UPI002FDED49E
MPTDHDLDANIITRVNAGDMLTRAAWRRPTHEAVIDGARRFTYRALNDEVNRLSHALLAAGYRCGDVLALASGNSVEFLTTYFACAKTGVVCVPVNLAWGPPEVSYVLEHSRARGVVVESQLADLVTAALLRLGSGTVTDVIVAPGTDASWEPGPTGRWQDLASFVGGAATTSPSAGWATATRSATSTPAAPHRPLREW